MMTGFPSSSRQFARNFSARDLKGCTGKSPLIWNELAQNPALALHHLSVPSFRTPKRIDWNVVSEVFQQDVEKYISWCAVSDPFAADARTRALAPRTLQLRRDEIHGAITALVQSGKDPSAIQSLADLVSPNHFKSILRTRLECETNTFNYFIGKTLVQMARDWVKVDPQVYAELKRLVSKMPAPVAGLTEKNKRALRQFDDPAVLRSPLLVVRNPLEGSEAGQTEPSYARKDLSCTRGRNRALYSPPIAKPCST